MSASTMKNEEVVRALETLGFTVDMFIETNNLKYAVRYYTDSFFRHFDTVILEQHQLNELYNSIQNGYLPYFFIGENNVKS